MAGSLLESEEPMRLKSRRKGAVLALTLVVLAFGIAFSGVTLYVIKNLFYSTKSVIDDVALTKAAESGLEMGKAWLAEKVEEAPPLPRQSAGIGEKVDVPSDLEDLVVHKIEVPASDSGDIGLEVTVYDLIYEAGMVDSAQLFSKGSFPPKVDEDVLKYIGSRRKKSTYANSNMRESVQPSSFEEGKYGAYLIVSKASYQKREKVVSEGILVVID